MAGPINTSTFFQANSKVLKAVYVNSAKKVPVLYPELFNEFEVDKKRPFFSVMPIVELGTLGVKTEGATPIIDQASEGVPTTFNFQTFGLQYFITEEAELEDAMSLVKLLPGMLAYSEQVTKDLLFWQILNLAFTSGVNGADGVPLCSTAHPIGSDPTRPITTVSNNAGAIALTPEALQNAYIAFQTLVSDRNLPASKTPTKLVVPPQLHKVAEEILGSPYYPYSNENKVNVVKGTVTPLVSRYLTSTTAWFVTAGKGDVTGDAHSMGYGFKWQNRQKTWTDSATGNTHHKTSFRATFGWKNWRGVYGSQGA